jgi:superfamily II DNA/RNA helicase
MGTKLEAFFRVLATESIDGAIVFANTRAATFRIHEALLAEGFNAGVLNGDLSQDERERALARMRGDSIQFLVATDVAARGIDISGLPAVINYDLPESAEVYIHRTGRTGRAGQFGVAYSLLTAADVTCHQALRKFFGIPMEIRSLPSSTTVARAPHPRPRRWRSYDCQVPRLRSPHRHRAACCRRIRSSGTDGGRCACSCACSRSCCRRGAAPAPAPRAARAPR